MSAKQDNRMQANRPSTLLVESSKKGTSPQLVESPLKNEQSPTRTTPSNIKVQQFMNVFKSSQPQSRSYRQTIEQIVSSFALMDSLTSRLEEKVDSMLNNQKLEFIQAYKRHMGKVREEFNQIDKKIQEYEKKILYYENEGEMSHLIIKVAKLEEECKNLYKNLGQKEKVLKDHELTIKVQRSELKRYEKELKLLMREKNDLLAKMDEKRMVGSGMEINNLEQEKSINAEKNQLKSIKSTNQFIFPTELQTHSRNDKHDLSTEYHFTSHQSPSHKHFVKNNQSNKSLTIDLSSDHHPLLTNLNPSPQSVHLQNKAREHQLKREISNLKKKNQILTSYQSRVLQSNTSMESFFVNCVNEIKQQIKIKKKINHECTFEEWKKEDKIELLIKVLSNDELLVYLYERLFRKGKVLKEEVKRSEEKVNQPQQSSKKHPVRSLYQPGMQTKDVSEPLITNKNRRLEDKQSRQRLLSLIKDKHTNLEEKKASALSHAKKRVPRHISENSLLPKIHFHLEY